MSPQRRAQLDRYAAIDCSTPEGVRAFAALGRWLAITERPHHPDTPITVPAPRRRDHRVTEPAHHAPPAHGWPTQMGVGRPTHVHLPSYRRAQIEGVRARHLA